jgi:hypothetical protein
MPGNILAWRIWNIANGKDRPLTQVGVGPIPSMAMIALCEVYDATLEDFEKVLTLEGLLYKGPSGGVDEEGEGEANPEKVIRQMKKTIKSARRGKK